MRTWRGIPLGLSGVLGAALAHGYFWRADWCVALTVWPAWVWVIPGLVLAGLGCSRATRIISALLGGAWLVFLGMFAEDPKSLLRGWFSAPTRGELRIVSLNCAGNAQAAAEAMALDPDVVLLQESPSEGRLQELSGERDTVVWGLDASIIARGGLQAVAPRRQRGEFHFVQARWRSPGGREVDLVSLRLAPNVLRTDLWRPACWREHAADRRQRRDWLRAVTAQLAAGPCIMGGDFNAPAGDAIYRELTPALYDVFAEAGRGWGNTLLNDLPVIRIDQIWVTTHFRAVNVRACRTQHSDHRLEVCDLTWR